LSHIKQTAALSIPYVQYIREEHSGDVTVQNSSSHNITPHDTCRIAVLVILNLIKSFSTRDSDSPTISAIVVASLDYPYPTINHNKDICPTFSTYPRPVSKWRKFSLQKKMWMVQSIKKKMEAH